MDLIFDAGVTVKEFNTLARQRAVRIAVKRVTKKGANLSKSRVAIVTGLPRMEVARIINLPDSERANRTDLHPARRVLAGWHNDSRYLAPNGAPAELSIFGNRRSFERLVEKYGAGIPVRAMLDELIQLNAVEQVEGQKVKARSRVPVSTGLSERSISAIGERARDLLTTLTHNVRRNSQPLFEATAYVDDGDFNKVAMIRREISDQGTNFINTATSLLTRSQNHAGSNSGTSKCRVGVTVFYFQDEQALSHRSTDSDELGRRKNLRRKPKELSRI